MTETQKVALVTGASSGIGKAIALRFGQSGWKVAVTARRAARLAEVAAAIDRAGGRAHAIAADLTEPEAPTQVVEETLDRFGGLEVLVNNAGTGGFAEADKVTDAAYETQFRLNVWSPTAMVRAVVPHFKAAGRGQIINIGSVVGYVGLSQGSIYASTKWALRGLNESWREELYQYNIKCAYVAPGYVITEFAGRSEDPADPANDELREWALYPEDIAHVVHCIATQGPNSDIKEIVVQVLDRS